MTDPIQAAIDAERRRALASLGARPAPRRSLGDLVRDVHGHMGAALGYALGGPPPEDDASIRWVGRSFDSMIDSLLSLRGVRWTTRQEMFARGISTGDVPALLEGAGNRLMRQAYDSYAGGVLGLCARVESRDFRDVKAIGVSGGGLVEVKEGEFTYGVLKVGAESFPIATFGRIYALSRNLFSDDDLAAFANMGARLGRMAAEFAAAKVAATLESTAVLSDGVAPFATAHKNLGSAGAISEATIGELLALVRNQTGLDGERIFAPPKAVVVPPGLEFTARKLVTLLGQPAPIEVVVEPRLTSATAYYVVADPSVLAPIAFTYPAGSEGPTLTIGARPGFEGLQARVAFDFGCGWTDHRGAAKNAGG